VAVAAEDDLQSQPCRDHRAREGGFLDNTQDTAGAPVVAAEQRTGEDGAAEPLEALEVKPRTPANRELVTAVGGVGEAWHSSLAIKAADWVDNALEPVVTEEASMLL